MNFASVIIATDHFNTHTAITMLGYQSVTVTGLTINPPTYGHDRSFYSTIPTVLLHMISKSHSMASQRGRQHACAVTRYMSVS